MRASHKRSLLSDDAGQRRIGSRAHDASEISDRGSISAQYAHICARRDSEGVSLMWGGE